MHNEMEKIGTGDALGDPQARFELELSVRAELLRATAAELPAGVKGG